MNDSTPATQAISAAQTISAAKVFNHFLKFAEKHNFYFDTADHYGEPGYTDPEEDIILANWNDCPSNLQEYLESAGFSLEWSDEWVCADNHPVYAYRISPDSYFWRPSYVQTVHGIIGRHELFQASEDGTEVSDFNCSAMDEYLEHLVIDHETIDHYLGCNNVDADTFDIDWSAAGFIPLSELEGFDFDDEPFETGLHAHQTDDPVKIIKLLEGEVRKGLEVIFQVTDVGQFDCRWKVWVREALSD